MRSEKQEVLASFNRKYKFNSSDQKSFSGHRKVFSLLLPVNVGPFFNLCSGGSTETNKHKKEVTCCQIMGPQEEHECSKQFVLTGSSEPAPEVPKESGSFPFPLPAVVQPVGNSVALPCRRHKTL